MSFRHDPSAPMRGSGPLPGATSVVGANSVQAAHTKNHATRLVVIAGRRYARSRQTATLAPVLRRHDLALARNAGTAASGCDRTRCKETLRVSPLALTYRSAVTPQPGQGAAFRGRAVPRNARFFPILVCRGGSASPGRHARQPPGPSRALEARQRSRRHRQAPAAPRLGSGSPHGEKALQQATRCKASHSPSLAGLWRFPSS